MRRLVHFGTVTSTAASTPPVRHARQGLNLSPERAADPPRVCDDRHMLGLIGFPLVVWLAIVGTVLFGATAGWGWAKRNTRA